jgi:hypothetical protein
MSCQENELSFGTDFSNLIISGLDGWADATGNGDGINSAQEAFGWAKFWIDLGGNQHPTEADLFGAEFPLTYS